MSAFGTSIAFAPLIPWIALWILAAAAIAGVVLGLVLGARGIVVRAFAFLLLWGILANPSLVLESREPQRDVAIVVVDESPSQALDGRDRRTAEALESIRDQVAKLGNLDLRVVRGGLERSEDGTILFDALERALADVPRQRLAGTIFITDGQVHDVPSAGRMITGIGPAHVLLSGRRGEADRRLVVESAPAFGLLGRPLQMTVRVEDDASPEGTRTEITIRRDGEPWRTVTVPVGRSTTLDFELDHPRTTFFEMEVGPGPEELTLENNRAVVAINGIRDRLRVLLISGEPHPGERAWRNILKSDPGVDLVHFTILRPPEKRDYTPINELALISFPVRELFQEKLDQFHLIIFDRYRRRGVIQEHYLQNIADYVRNGGALMVAAGPEYAERQSMHHTPIGPVLPAEPTGEVLVQGFRAERTDTGTRHPVTAPLPGGGSGERWGRWFRHVDANVLRGEVLLRGARERPLLVLDRVEKGRVAQLLSDQAWLWDRGFEGGGPQAELLRRVAHWLMKEPDLEENRLVGRIRGDTLEIERRTLQPTDRRVTVTAPDGTTETLTLEGRGDGSSAGSLKLTMPGLYRISDGVLTTMAAVGSLNAKEMEDVRTTDRKMEPVIAANGGSVVWMGDDGVPELRRVADEARRVAGAGGFAGGPWIGLRQRGDYVVTGIRDVPLMVGFLALLIALLPLLLAWRREGR